MLESYTAPTKKTRGVLCDTKAKGNNKINRLGKICSTVRPRRLPCPGH